MKRRQVHKLWCFGYVSMLVFALLSVDCKAQSGPPETLAQAIEQADHLSQKTFDDQKFPGMAVAVSIDGMIVWEKGYGMADREKEIPVDPSISLFRIGSVSKTLTSVALAQLIEDEKLNLDDELQKYVPYFPEKRYPITSRQVGGHLAGVRHYHGMEFLNNVYYEDVKSSMDIFKADTLLFEPGTKYSYSSYGWNLLSGVIEGSSGEEFLDYMREKVFIPAGMYRTHPEYKGKFSDHKVAFYIKDINGHLQLAPDVDNSYKWAGGGFIGTARDLLYFSNAVLDRKILEESSYLTLVTAQTTSDGKSTGYGIGWRSAEDKKGRPWVGHSGGSMGGSTMFLVYPEHKLTVVTLVNLSSARTNNLAGRVAEQFLSVME